jgi:Phosphate-starvation-inducible E family
MSSTERPRHPARDWLARGFTLVEDAVYIGLGLVLACSAFTLLATGAIDFAKAAWKENTAIIALLDRILLILLIVELLYTVQVSFREHALLPQPFLLIGLISAIRRVLLITAEFGEAHVKEPGAVQDFAIELSVLTVLILAMVGALVLLTKNPVTAKRA